MPKAVIKQDPLMSAIGMIKNNHPEYVQSSEKHKIVDIITFCDDPLYLNLLTNRLNLYIPQRIILKAFYMGTIGNESLKLTTEEWQWLHDNEEPEEKDGEVYDSNMKSVIRKLLNREKSKDPTIFSQLVLVLGRRSGKTVIASIISVYEAYKLLVINDGDPHSYYSLPTSDDIYIINVALSQDQASILFGNISSRVRDSAFFPSRVASAGADEIRLYTDKDLEKKKSQTALKVPGSVVLRCGHSNPDSLAGRSAILILFDEIAYYEESGKVTGTYFYERLTPSLSMFYERKASKIVLISSPNTQNGIFYKQFEDSEKEDSTLAFQLPTWKVNRTVPYELSEMAQHRRANIERFRVEFGAQWATSGTMGNMFEPELIDRCIRGDIGPHKRPDPHYNYYLHVDPAQNGDNYVAVLVAKQRYSNHLGHKRNRCILAGCWVWRASPGIGLQFSLIDKDVIRICQIFHPIMVTYDQFNSVHSLQLLRNHGINTRQLAFNRGTKMRLYQNLYDIMSYQPAPELQLYDDGGESSLLIKELKNLRKKRAQRGFGIVPYKHGDVSTDDLADALAGSCSAANEGLQMSLPAPVVVHSGLR